MVEKSFDDSAVEKIFAEERAIKNSDKPNLSVRVATLEGAKKAVENGANLIYVGGEVFKPQKSWTIEELKNASAFAKNHNAKIILNTPRVTEDKILNELAELMQRVDEKIFDGVMVSNLGSLDLFKKISALPIYADTSFNIFNQSAAEFLKILGVVQAAASTEMSFAQVRSVVENSPVPIEIIIHGSIESMVCKHNFIELYHPNFDEFATPELLNKHFAFEDSAGEIHSIRVDQLNYQHIYFAKDLCLLPYAEKFFGASSLRIDAQDYSPEVVGLVTKIYRAAIDKKDFKNDFEELKKISPRKFGCGVYRFKESKNSI